jgi:hypothetical protein
MESERRRIGEVLRSIQLAKKFADNAIGAAAKAALGLIGRATGLW